MSSNPEEHQGLLERGYIFTDEVCKYCKVGNLYWHSIWGPLCDNYKCKELLKVI